MKRILYKIVDRLFYNFVINTIEENFRIVIFLKSENFKKEIHMFYVPQIGSKIKVESGVFEVKEVIHATFGAVAYLNGFYKPN